jgi:hypothetical protein
MKVTMWKAPKARDYQPKATDAGQVITWTREHPGHWTVAGASWGDPRGGEWVAASTETMAGVIWSAGPQARSLWARCDDGTMAALKLAAGGGAFELAKYSATWQRDTIRRCEHLARSRGIVAEVRTTSRYEYGKGNVEREDVTGYHSDRDCPDIRHELRPACDWEMSVGSLTRMLLDTTAFGYPGLCQRCIYLIKPDAEAPRAAA